MIDREFAIKHFEEEKKEYGNPSIFADCCDIAIESIKKIQEIEEAINKTKRCVSSAYVDIIAYAKIEKIINR